MDRRVFFLGAGAAADAGVPILRKLQNVIMQQLDSAPSKYTPPLLGLLKKFASDDPIRHGRAPIVDFISLLDSCIRDNRPLDRTYTVDKLRRIREHFIVALAKAVTVNEGELVQIPLEAELEDQLRRVPKHLKTFVEKIRPGEWSQQKNRLTFADAVITTNYDSTLDVALYEHVYRDNPDKTDVFLGSDFRDPYDDADAFSDSERPVCFLKLHGSVNWLWCPVCNRIYVAAFTDNVVYLERGMKDESTCDCSFFPLEPVIVAPTVFQDLANPHLLNIWRNAYIVLEDADEWFFVGYSLPPEDIAVRTLLYRAYYARRSNHRKTRLVIVDPDRSYRQIASRLHGLLDSTVHCHNMTFKKYIESKMS